MFQPDEGRVIKVTKNAPFFGLRGDLLDYLRNIQWSNLCSVMHGHGWRLSGRAARVRFS